jgi:N-formylglutamate amidohydrolase
MVFSCPHAGRDYPKKLLAQSPLPLELLRRSEDAYVDQLIPGIASQAVPVIAANFPRLFVDVNRSPRELDPQLFSGSLDDASESRSNRVVAGFGVIPKLAANGRPIYPSRLPSSEARSRLKNCFSPYHEALQTLLDDARKRFGSVLLVDWHSMPSTYRGPSRLPDIVLGDLYGASCEETDIAVWEDAFRTEGFEVARNTPYAGGYVASHYGQPRKGVGVLQVEINRGLYLDEQRVARASHFKTFARRIERVILSAFEAFAPRAQAAE